MDGCCGNMFVKRSRNLTLIKYLYDHNPNRQTSRPSAALQSYMAPFLPKVYSAEEEIERDLAALVSEIVELAMTELQNEATNV
jgi:hypothetical protein